MVRYSNVYGDTSGVYRFDYLEQAVRRAGPEKLLFGSDGPWLHPAAELYKVRLLRLPAAAEALVLGGNVARLLARVRAQPAIRPELARSRTRSRVTVAVESTSQRDVIAPPGQADYQL
jgi:hypothetical protein